MSEKEQVPRVRKALSDNGIRVIVVEENNDQVRTAADLKAYAEQYPGITVLRDNGYGFAASAEFKVIVNDMKK